MHRLRFALVTLALLCVTSSLRAESPRYKLLARDVTLDHTVIALKVPERDHGAWLQIVIVDTAGEVGAYGFVARGGEHIYDLRWSQDWKGRARLVATTLLSAEGLLRRPTTSDEIDAFFEPEPFLPASVNVLRGHHLFGASWELVLLLIGAATAGGVYRATRRVGPALLIGFCLAWAVMDARTMFDHASVVRRHETRGTDPQVFALADAVAFADRASPAIGSGSWTADATLDTLSLTKHYLVGYAFADRRYVPNEPGAPQSDYVVTCDPKQGTVIVSHGALHLIQRTAR